MYLRAWVGSLSLQVCVLISHTQHYSAQENTKMVRRRRNVNVETRLQGLDWNGFGFHEFKEREGFQPFKHKAITAQTYKPSHHDYSNCNKMALGKKLKSSVNLLVSFRWETVHLSQIINYTEFMMGVIVSFVCLFHLFISMLSCCKVWLGPIFCRISRGSSSSQYEMAPND